MNPYPPPITYLPLTSAMRLRLEATIESLIALLDEIDGSDDEMDADAEPSLGALNNVHQGPWGVDGYGEGDDREREAEHDQEFGTVI